MRKRIISFLCLLGMLAGLMCVNAFAAGVYNTIPISYGEPDTRAQLKTSRENMKYTINDTSRVTAYQRRYVIPSSISLQGPGLPAAGAI